VHHAHLTALTAASTDLQQLPEALQFQHNSLAQLPEALAKVLRQKGVDYRVHTAVGVSQAGRHDLESDHLDVVIFVDVGKRFDEERDVARQPAESKCDDDRSHHFHHATSSGRRLGRRSAHLAQVAADPTLTSDTKHQKDVQDADDDEWNGVADSEERGVVDATVALDQRRVVDAVHQGVDAVAACLVLERVLGDAIPRRTVAAAHQYLRHVYYTVSQKKPHHDTRDRNFVRSFTAENAVNCTIKPA